MADHVMCGAMRESEMNLLAGREQLSSENTQSGTPPGRSGLEEERGPARQQRWQVHFLIFPATQNTVILYFQEHFICRHIYMIHRYMCACMNLCMYEVL